jgi:hypothetical protein
VPPIAGARITGSAAPCPSAIDDLQINPPARLLLAKIHHGIELHQLYRAMAWLGEAVSVRRIGPGLVFERLWDETGCRTALLRQFADHRCSTVRNTTRSRSNPCRT